MSWCAYVAAGNANAARHRLAETDDDPVETRWCSGAAVALRQAARLTAHSDFVVAPWVRTNIIRQPVSIVVTQASDGERARATRIIKLLTAPRSGSNGGGIPRPKRLVGARIINREGALGA